MSRGASGPVHALAERWHDLQRHVGYHRADYLAVTRLDRPVGIFLLMWPTLWALWIAADGVPPAHLLFIFCAGVVLTRSAGCVINDYADRDFDRHVERTRARPLTTGRLHPREAMLLGAVLTALAGILVLFTNLLTIGLAVVAATIAALYPFMKRWTHLPQVVLGIAFGCSIPMAFAAQTGTVPPVAWLLFTANLFWTVAYDTWYAMVDRDDDLKVGIRSSAILFGRSDLFMIAVLDGAAVLTLLLVGMQLGYGPYWILGLVVAAILLARQVVRGRSRSREVCFAAFLDNIRVGGVVFAGLVLDRALWSPALTPQGWVTP